MYYNNKELCASEHLWYVKEGHSPIYRSKLFMNLLKEGVRTLKTLGINLVTIGLPKNSSIGDSVGSFLKRNEFIHIENIYKRRF